MFVPGFDQTEWANPYPQQTPPGRPGSPPRRQRACAPCSKAKARCNFRDENIGKHCDRCFRLGVDCTSQTTKSIRRPRQIKQSPARWPAEWARLIRTSAGQANAVDQAVDNLAALLSSTQSVGTVAEQPHAAFSVTSSPGYGVEIPFRSIPTPPLSISHYARVPVSPTPPGQSAQASLSSGLILSSAAPASPGYGLTWDQAEFALKEYLGRYMENFPFVVIDPLVNAQELYLEKPFLFRVVMMVACRVPPARRKAMQRNVAGYLGQHLLVQEERTLDLLQGLLVYIAWGDLSFYLDRQITHLIHLAVGFAHNLGLTKNIPHFSELRSKADASGADDAEEAMYLRNPQVLQALEKAHNLDEQRAFLGVYYLVSVNSSQFARRNGFQSSYVDLCRYCLQAASETSFDFILEKLIHLQQVVDKIFDTFPIARDSERPRRSAYLTQDEMRPLRAQLARISESIDPVHPQFQTFWLHYNYVMVRLYEPATYLVESPMNTGNLYRTQCLLYCLQASKTYFTTLSTLPTEGYIYRSFVSGAELLGVIVVTSRLLLLHAENWDLTIARQTLDFPSTVQRVIDHLDQASKLIKERGGDHRADDHEMPQRNPDEKDAFDKYVEKARYIKIWYEARVSAESSGAAGAGALDRNIFPWDLSPPDTQDSQFWLGLLPPVPWNIDF